MELTKKDYTVDGVDASPGMLSKLQQKFERIKLSSNFYVSESAKLPFKDTLQIPPFLIAKNNISSSL